MLVPYGLLLLPPPPSAVDLSALSVALEPALHDAIRRMSKLADEAGTESTLDVALACPGFASAPAEEIRNRVWLFTQVQELLTLVYTLIASIYERSVFRTDGTSSVDTRVVLTSYDPTYISNVQPHLHSSVPPVGVIDLPILASSSRSWTHIFIVHSEPGEQLFRHFESHAVGGLAARFGPNWKPIRVPGGLQIRLSKTPEALSDQRVRQCYDTVSCCGISDRLDFGHKLVLTMSAFLICPSRRDTPCEKRRIVIGLADVREEAVEAWEQRQKAINDFLVGILRFVTPELSEIKFSSLSSGVRDARSRIEEIWPGFTIECVPISCLHDPGALDKSNSALILSTESRSEVTEVNGLRSQIGWDDSDVFDVGVVRRDAFEISADLHRAPLSLGELEG